MSTKRLALALVTDTGLVRRIKEASPEDARRIVVEHKLGRRSFGKSDAWIVGAFDRLTIDLAADAQPSQWAVGASRDLPISERGGWDGAAAQRRIFELARFSTDSPRVDIARRAHLIYDRANSTMRGAYKLPFADVESGRLVVMPAALSAARGRLRQTDAPAAVLDRAEAVLDGYRAKMEKRR